MPQFEKDLLLLSVRYSDASLCSGSLAVSDMSTDFISAWFTLTCSALILKAGPHCARTSPSLHLGIATEPGGPL